MENTQVGPFRILKRLGTSRRQQVFHAVQESQQKDVALKFISLPSHVEWEDSIGKIDREAIELRKLQHKNLVRIYGAGVHEKESKLFFATELIDGEPLSAILARRGKLTPDLVVEYGGQIAKALEYIHKHDVIHSKLSPDKILITPDHRVKVSDLRLNRPNKRRWDATRKRDLEIAAYMAPEQFAGGATKKSDFYALGVILFELLTGKLPYAIENMGRIAKAKQEVEAPSVAEEVMNCPIWLDKIITQMVQADQKARPHSAKAITFAFDEIKKMDTTRMSAASQVAGNFNPLNAGVDKTKAREALGKKTIRTKADETSFWQKTPVLILALAAVTCFSIWAAIPKSKTAILDEAAANLASKDPEQWRKVAVDVKPLLDAEDESIAARASELYYDSKEQILEMNGRSGIRSGARNLYSDHVIAYIDAKQKFLAGEHRVAEAEFERLVLEVDPDGDERYVRRVAVKQLQQLAGKLSLPEDPEILAAMVEGYDRETNKLKLMQGEKVLTKIMRNFGGSLSHVKVCKAARKQLETIQSRISGDASGSEDGAE